MKLENLGKDTIMILTIGLLCMLSGSILTLYKFLDVVNIISGCVIVFIGIAVLSLGYDFYKADKGVE